MAKNVSVNNQPGLTAQNELTGDNEFLYSRDHALNVNMVEGGSVSLFTLPYDEIQATYPTATTEVYESYLGGVLQQTVTVTYTDSSKDYIDNVVRT